MEMEASNDLFINLIQNNPIVYDKKSNDFKKTSKKEHAWNKIAGESRMTVEGAKKRYASLRQKYCREKNSNELRRRLKQRPVKAWVYYDRLSFLDAYIQPRTTFTNDISFNSALHDPENSLLASNDEGSNVDTLPHKLASRVDDNESIEFLSEYSGELTQFQPSSLPFIKSMGTSFQNEEIFEESVGCSAATTTSEIPLKSKEMQQNLLTVSPLSDYAPVVVPRPRLLGESARANADTTPSQDPSSSREMQQDMLSVPRNSNYASPPVVAPRPRILPCNTITTAATSSSKEQATLDGIRNKMNSCLTAIATKVSEKSQRSPHAPFLAYLDTKLVNVAKERLPQLEKDILNLTESYQR